MKNLKYAILSLVLGFSARSIASLPVGDDAQISDGVVMVFDEHGHEVPFPRNAVILFPWEVIEGYWAATIGEIPGVFGFKVDSMDASHKRLKIVYMDPSRTRVLAEGIGYIDDEAKSIHANLQGVNINAAIVVSAYRLREGGIERTEMVTSVVMKGSSHPDSDNFIIRKIGN